MYIKLAGSSYDFTVMVFELHLTLHYEDYEAKLAAAIPVHDHCEPVLTGRTFSVLPYVDFKMFNFRYAIVS